MQRNWPKPHRNWWSRRKTLLCTWNTWLSCKNSWDSNYLCMPNIINNAPSRNKCTTASRNHACSTLSSHSRSTSKATTRKDWTKSNNSWILLNSNLHRNLKTCVLWLRRTTSYKRNWIKSWKARKKWGSYKKRSWH